MLRRGRARGEPGPGGAGARGGTCSLVLRVRGPLGDLDPDVVTDRVAVVGGALRRGNDLLELTVPVPEQEVAAQP